MENLFKRITALTAVISLLLPMYSALAYTPSVGTDEPEIVLETYFKNHKKQCSDAYILDIDNDSDPELVMLKNSGSYCPITVYECENGTAKKSKVTMNMVTGDTEFGHMFSGGTLGSFEYTFCKDQAGTVYVLESELSHVWIKMNTESSVGESLTLHKIENGTAQIVGRYTHSYSSFPQSGTEGKHEYKLNGVAISQQEYETGITQYESLEKLPMRNGNKGTDLYKYWDIIKVFVNNERVVFDQAPIQDEQTGRVLVPIRRIAEAMGDTVKWNNEYQAALILHGGISSVITINEDAIYTGTSSNPVAWRKYALDKPAINHNGRTLVPVRGFCESLNCKVEWSESERSVYITYDPSRRGNNMSDDDIDLINAKYYARKNPANPFAQYRDALIQYDQSRNKAVDNLALWWTDAFSNIATALPDAVLGTNLSSADAEKWTRESLIKMLTYMESDSVTHIDPEVQKLAELNDKAEDFIVNFFKSGLLGDISESTEKLGLSLELTKFTYDELMYIFSDFKSQTDCIQMIKENIDNKEIEDILDKINDDFCIKYLDVLENTSKKALGIIVDKVSGAVLGKAGGAIFSLAQFAHGIGVSFSGLDEKTKALGYFEGYIIYSTAIDQMYQNLRRELANDECGYDTAVKFKKAFEIERASKIFAYECVKGTNKGTAEVADSEISDIKEINYMIWND